MQDGNLGWRVVFQGPQKVASTMMQSFHHPKVATALSGSLELKPWNNPVLKQEGGSPSGVETLGICARGSRLQSCRRCLFRKSALYGAYCAAIYSLLPADCNFVQPLPSTIYPDPHPPAQPNTPSTTDIECGPD